MQATLLLEYPEFLIAALLGIVFLRFGRAGRADLHAPPWLAAACTACLQPAPEKYLSWLSRDLVWAGWRSNRSFGDFASIKILLSGVAILSAGILPVYAVLPLAVAGFLLPDLLLLVWVKKRQQEILDSLPQALDLMVLCVDAGLGLDATLQRIASGRTAIARSLNDELNTLGRDVLLGMDRERAYQELYNRTGVDELKTLGSALTQAGKLGLSIARILRAQSEFVRQKQGQKAEEKALKLPILMAFPLWFCIMPALMLLVLAPSLITFFQHIQFGTGLFR